MGEVVNIKSNTYLIDSLEKLLKQAKEGKLLGMLAVLSMEEDDIDYFVDFGDADVLKFMGGLEILKYQLMSPSEVVYEEE